MNILTYLKDHFLILDGGTGTVLQAAGLKSGERPESWNLSRPEEVTRLHAAYFAAGSHVVAANTFGVNLFHYARADAEQLISAAFQCARAAQQGIEDHPTWVAMDLGPTGRMLEPFGDLAFEEAVSSYAFLVREGVRCGADLFMIETVNDCLETKAALLAVKENSTLPVFVSNAYSANGRLLSGTEPAAMVAMLEGMGADVIGVNCSAGPDSLAPVVREYLAHASVPVLMKANAGIPRVENGCTVFDVTPEDFARTEAALAAEGVRVLGGCCGTTPEHIRLLNSLLSAVSPLPVTDRQETVVSSGAGAVYFGDTPLLIGERINPTGKKRLKQALLENDIPYILEQAGAQAEKGVHLLDVNAGVPGIDEAAVLSSLVRELQAVTALPLQLDTSDPAAMAAALRVYRGKALINSVSGKQESMDAIFPLVRKYGGVVIALTLDENGIPETAQGRVDIARRILREAEKYGITRKNIVFDTLAMTVSAAPEAAAVTLDALSVIRHELGCHTSLGISNVSFGLPDRDGINAVFFAMAMEHGLSAAIMNPFSVPVMKAWRAFLTLHAMDPDCGGWIASAAADVPQTPLQEAEITSLNRAIVRGYRRQASDLTGKLLAEQRDPLELISDEIIPALNTVGEGFEKQTLFLPQLLMSAEAAAAAFGVIRSSAEAQNASSGSRGKIVLATVRGDVHDIGKNIVRLLLENYGFEVIDLGKDVPPEVILQTVLEKDIRLVGLSALMTTTVPAMEDTVRLLHEKVPGIRVVVGGAVLTADYARRIGADRYAADAMNTVRYAESVFCDARL